jgi:hypothetical protein
MHNQRIVPNQRGMVDRMSPQCAQICDYDLTGLIDFHTHTAPDVVPCLLDDLHTAQDARAAGMRAIVIKSHVTCTADWAVVAEKAVEGIRVLGGLALNNAVGGLNPDAVDAAHSRQIRGRIGGISLLIAGPKLATLVGPILELIRDASAILGIDCHSSSRTVPGQLYCR